MNVQTIYKEYENKTFNIPKALFFGKYEALSMKSRFYFVYFKEISKVSNSGTLYIELDEVKEYEDVLNELESFDLVVKSNNILHFTNIEIDNEIVKKIQDLEQNKTINIKDEKEYKQEKLIEQAFFNNEDLPERLLNILQVFSESTDDAQMYFEIIMKAKKKVEEDSGEIIWLDHDEELLETVINSFSRCIRKVNKEKIRNKKGYIYKGIVINLSQKVMHRQRQKNASNLYNWLDET